MFLLNNSVDANYNYNYNNNDNDDIQDNTNHQLYEHHQHQHRLLYYMSSQLVYYYSMFVFFLVLCLFVGCYPFDCRTPVEKEEDERRLQLEAAGIILEEGQRAINVHRNADDVTVIEEVNDDDNDEDEDDNEQNNNLSATATAIDRNSDMVTDVDMEMDMDTNDTFISNLTSYGVVSTEIVNETHDSNNSTGPTQPSIATQRRTSTSGIERRKKRRRRQRRMGTW
mmetsp:Transcript_35917/g.40017  ORF Transcript_35917/g.40017 Transcript_35917/m.40017 type:complete len:225 (+) Transcript_35917:157-831(+)